jgi:hypothetical protein
MLNDTICGELRVASGYWYLASPYSKYPGGIEAAFAEISRVTARLTQRGIRVYAPIVHGHPQSQYGGIDPFDHAVWMAIDAPWVRDAHGLIVCKMDTWDKSCGIGEEIKEFTAAGKPVVYLEPL